MAKALGDPTRLELLRRISSAGEMCCKDLVALFPIAQATVSHHLKILVDAELLAVRRGGQFGWYSLRPETLAAHTDLLGRTVGAARKQPAARSPGGTGARGASRSGGTARPSQVSSSRRGARRADVRGPS